MANSDFKFVRFFTIDLIEIEIYKNAIGEYKTVCTFIDCVDKGTVQYYANFEELYYLYSDYLDNVELEFEPSVVILKHHGRRSQDE